MHQPFDVKWHLHLQNTLKTKDTNRRQCNESVQLSRSPVWRVCEPLKMDLKCFNRTGINMLSEYYKNAHIEKQKGDK